MPTDGAPSSLCKRSVRARACLKLSAFSDCLRQPDDLFRSGLGAHGDEPILFRLLYGETHGFASLPHSRFALIVYNRCFAKELCHFLEGCSSHIHLSCFKDVCQRVYFASPAGLFSSAEERFPEPPENTPKNPKAEENARNSAIFRPLQASFGGVIGRRR